MKGKNAFTRLRYVDYANGTYRGENHLEFYASADAMEDDATPPVAVLISDVRTQLHQVFAPTSRYSYRKAAQYVLEAADPDYANEWRAQEERKIQTEN